MAEKIQRREIGKEIYLSRFTDKRAKFNVVSVNFITPVSEETVSEYSVLARVLAHSNSKYPTYSILNNKLSSLYAARLDCDVITGSDVQFISFTCEYIDNKYAFDNERVGAEAMDILMSCIFDPIIENGGLSEKITKLECQSVIDDINSELSNKYSHASRRFCEILFEGEPAAISGLGSISKVKQITPKSLLKAYQRILTHCRAEIICAGSSDFEDERKILSEAFSKLHREDIFSFATKPSPLKEKPKRVTDYMPLSQSTLMMGYKTDCKNQPALRLMSDILGGSPTSKLFVNVREKLSLCYFCWSHLNYLKGALSVSSGVDKVNIEKAAEQIELQISKLGDGDFTDEELEQAKIYRSSFLRACNDSVKHMGAWYLVRIYEDDIKSPEDIIEEDKRVTRDEIIEAAKSLRLDTVYVLSESEKTEEK